MTFDRSTFIAKFVHEATELIQKLNDHLIELEREPYRLELIKNILRIAHTLKGSSKILRFQNMSEVLHKMEDLLIQIQDQHVPLTQNVIELLFQSVDIISQCVNAILNGKEQAVDITAMSKLLDSAAQGDILSHMPVESRLPKEPARELAPASMKSELISSEKISFSAPISKETIRVSIDKLDAAIRLMGEIAVTHRKSYHVLNQLNDIQRIARKHARIIRRIVQGDVGDLHEITKTLFEESFQIVKNIEYAVKEHRDETASMEMIVNDLNEEILNMRMLPISSVFETFPRAIRDMAKQSEKEVELRIIGEETLLDKKIIEKLGSPLIHILRNSIDHGIETPEERVLHGKSRIGMISINVHQRSGHIQIVISDDGRGIQCEKLKQRALQQGLISAESANTFDEAELLDLVFLPRLSTSDIVTDISGRGVGMDIVKTTIEQLKGTVSLSSKLGKGTTCVLTLPMTLTTLRSVIVLSQGIQFAVPINSIEETLQISSDELNCDDHREIHLKNRTIHAVNLARILGLPQKDDGVHEQRFLLIIYANDKRYGLIVDEIVDEQEIIIKQLPPHMQQAKTIAGAAIANDNTIILILHIPEIFEAIKSLLLEKPSQENVAKTDRPTRILLVEDSESTGDMEKRMLENEGYQIELMNNAADALRLLEHTAYDLVVTDIEMPGMDGFTLIEHIRKLPQYINIPIVIVTSLEREADKERGIQVGANAYILKETFEQSVLTDTVKSLILKHATE